MCAVWEEGSGEALHAISSGFSDAWSLLCACGCVCAWPHRRAAPRECCGKGGCQREGCGPPVGVGSAGHGVGGCIHVCAHLECVGEQSRAGEALDASSIPLASGESTLMSLPWHWALSLSPPSWVWAFTSPKFPDKRLMPVLCPWLLLAVPRSLCPLRGCCRAWCRFVFIFIPVFFGKKIFPFVSCI